MKNASRAIELAKNPEAAAAELIRKGTMLDLLHTAMIDIHKSAFDLYGEYVKKCGKACQALPGGRSEQNCAAFAAMVRITMILAEAFESCKVLEETSQAVVMEVARATTAEPGQRDN